MRVTSPRLYAPRQRLSRRRLLTGLVAAGAAVAAGCTSDSSKATPGGAAGVAAPRDFLSSIPENSPDPFTERDIRVGGTLIRIFNRQTSLDYMTTSSISPVAEVTTPVYSRLIRLACRANMKSVLVPELEGDLATAWEQPDTTTVIFTLAPNIKYQPQRPLNGRAFTVEDIAFSFNRGKTFQRSVFKSYYSRIERVEDVGGGKVKLTLTEPYPAIQQLLGSVFMQIMPPEIGENPDLAQTTAVGTGGMMIVKATPNVEFVYQKHPEFFKIDSLGRRRPYIDGYALSIVTDPATQMALFESGKADFIYGAANPITLDNVEDFAKRNPKVILQLRPVGVSSQAIAWHNDQAPWNDPRVRRALALAVDQQTIIQTIFRGQAITGPFFPWTFLFDRPPTLKDLGPHYSYDPRQARQLLAAAGFPDGLTVDLTWFEASYATDMMTLFQRSAAEAGIRINLIKSPDLAAHFAKLNAKNWQGLIHVGRSPGFLDPAATMPYFLPGSDLNFGNVNDPTLVSLNIRLENALGEERKTVAKQIWDRLLSEVYEAALPTVSVLTAWQPRLRNFRDTSWNASYGSGMGQMDGVWLSK